MNKQPATGKDLFQALFEPRSALAAARYNRSCAASSLIFMSANFHCSPWNSHSRRPNWRRSSAQARAAS